MSILTIGSISSQSLMPQLGTLDRLKRNALPSSQGDSGLSSGSSGNPASISGFGQILNQLQNLATGKPAQFKQQTANIASQLGAMASQAKGFEAQLFQNLATQFQQASQTGQVPKLTQNHHSRHYHGSSTVPSNAVNKSGAGNLTGTASTTKA